MRDLCKRSHMARRGHQEVRRNSPASWAEGKHAMRKCRVAICTLHATPRRARTTSWMDIVVFSQRSARTDGDFEIGESS